MEPASPFPLKRLETIQRLSEEGIYAGVFLAPILPYLTDSLEELTHLFKQAAAHHVQFVMPSFLRLSTSEVKVWFFRTLHEVYPKLVKPYSELYGSSRTAPSSYREPIRRHIDSLLQEFKLHLKEPLEASKDPVYLQTKDKESMPVQLSFSF